MYKVIAVSVLLGVFLAACGSYATPPEDFLSARVQFADPELAKKSITVAGFVDFVRGLKSGDQETRILGWVAKGESWTLVSESAGEKYEYRFADVMTDRGGKQVVVLHDIYRDGKSQDKTTLLNLIIK